MRIKSLLALSSRISIAVVAIIAVSIGATTVQIQKENTHLAIASEILKTLFERMILRDDYYYNRGDRSLKQIQSKNNQLESLLDGEAKSSSQQEPERILSEMKSVNTSLIRLFKIVVANAQERTSTMLGGTAFSEYNNKLLVQILVKSYILRDDARMLETWYYSRLENLNRALSILISISLAFIILLVIINSAWIAKILSHGIESLKTGTARLGEGDLAYRLTLVPDDEIADVARGINAMAESLAASFTSIRNLEHEVVQRKRAEEEVLRINAELEERIKTRTSQLESSNKELESFAYSVAHDLRAPLRSIDGFTRIIQENYDKVLDDEGRRILGIIRASDQKMDELIKNLLEITRLGKTELSYTLIDMGTLAIESFQRCADPELLAKFDISVGDLPPATADASMMERVWLNLLSNAVKYSIPSNTHRIEIHGSEKKGMYEYSVKDYGVGFDPAYTEKLFTMFQRLHAMEEFPGTGVGLAIVQKVIQRHGGTVRAEGQTGKGAIFWFSLPKRS